MKLLVASRNTKKLTEVQRVLASADLASIEVVGLDTVEEFPETPETGATFAENSLIKARDGAVHSGWVTVADDSGLTVDALNGMRGFFRPAGVASTAVTRTTWSLYWRRCGMFPRNTVGQRLFLRWRLWCQNRLRILRSWRNVGSRLRW